MKRLFMALSIAAVLTTAAGLASAQTRIFDDTIGTCTGANCSSLRLPGSLFAFGPSAGYYEIGLFAGPGECLRAELISEGADLEMVVRAPNGSVFRNDDKGGPSCPLCPRVAISSTPNNGWYSTTLYAWNGVPVEANFVLVYGRYPIGNPNCSSATLPVSAEQTEAAVEKPAQDVSPPRRGHPGNPDRE
jgi:hypothetical protein